MVLFGECGAASQLSCAPPLRKWPTLPSYRHRIRFSRPHVPKKSLYFGIASENTKIANAACNACSPGIHSPFAWLRTLARGHLECVQIVQRPEEVLWNPSLDVSNSNIQNSFDYNKYFHVLFLLRYLTIALHRSSLRTIHRGDIGVQRGGSSSREVL